MLLKNNSRPVFPCLSTSSRKPLKAGQGGETAAGLRISGAPGGDSRNLSEIGVAGAAHGTELLRLGYTVDQVLHDYGNLCQAITDLAMERDAPFSINEFRTLNRCLDNAIADAVTKFTYLRESAMAQQLMTDSNEHLGFLMHEIKNSLNAAVLAVTAMESGSLGLQGATGGVLKRSLDAAVISAAYWVEFFDPWNIDSAPMFYLIAVCPMFLLFKSVYYTCDDVHQWMPVLTRTFSFGKR